MCIYSTKLPSPFFGIITIITIIHKHQPPTTSHSTNYTSL